MAIVKYRSSYYMNCKVNFQMETSGKQKQNKPPLLPKPKGKLPPRRILRKPQVINQSLHNEKPQNFEDTNSAMVNPSLSETSSELKDVTSNIFDDKASICKDFDESQDSNFEDTFDCIIQSLETSGLESLDGDKESDSDLTDSASQRSIEATLNASKIDANSEAFLIANEFADSEKTYIDSLHLIVSRLKEFIAEYSQNIGINEIIPQNELNKIISSLPQLLSLNEDLYLDLKQRVENWDDFPKIADVIVKKGPFLKLYTTYIKEFETLCNYLDECRLKYPKFAEALIIFESKPFCKNLNLKHYMLKPIQRIPQYRLLLQKYIKNINLESTEHADALKALQIIQQVLSHTNDTLNLDNTSKLLQIQSKLGSHEIIKPGRKFIKEGDLLKLSRKEIQLRFFVLLSDCLLYTIYVTLSTLKVKYELPLLGMKVHTDCTEKYEFSVITSTRSFTLRARDGIEYYSWVKSLQIAIDDNNQRQLTFACVRSVENVDDNSRLKFGQEAPVWIQDKRTTMCQVCTAEFTMTFRRHHCRSCGKVVCSKCSSNKAPLAYLKFDSARVCKSCYDYLLQEVKNKDRKLLEIIKSEMKMVDEEAFKFLDTLLGSFKRYIYQEKSTRFVPQRLKEVPGDELGDITASGWLRRRNKRGWKRLWFVLKASVLYEYKAPHDVVAHRSLPVLGYEIAKISPSYEDYDSLSFSLNHSGQPSLEFMALSEDSYHMWISALIEATILK